MFSYAINKQVSDSPTLGDQQKDAFVVSDPSTNCTPINLAAGITSSSTEQELLGLNMRLISLGVEESLTVPGQYFVNVRVAYGDGDLLNSQGNCKGGAGDQYCAVRELDTVAQQRGT
jgi:hypothetical protein